MPKLVRRWPPVTFVLLLVVAGLAPAFAVAQTDAGAARLDVATSLSTYAVGEPVTVQVHNSGDVAYTGDLRFEVHRQTCYSDPTDTSCPDVKVHDHTRRDVHLGPGAYTFWTWDQSTSNGTAPLGQYVVRLIAGVDTDRSTFTIDPAPAGSRPFLDLVQPADEGVYGQTLPVRFRAIDDDGLARADVIVRDPEDGSGQTARTVASFDLEGQTDVLIVRNLSVEAVGGPGTWTVSVSVVDTGGNPVRQLRTVTVGHAPPVVEWSDPREGAAYENAVPWTVRAQDLDGVYDVRLLRYAPGTPEHGERVAGATYGGNRTTVAPAGSIRLADLGGTGEHCLTLEVEDRRGQEFADTRCFQVSAGTAVRVSTDRDAYPVGSRAQITVTNTGSTTLTGQAHFNVSEAARYHVVYPDAAPGITRYAVLEPGASISFEWDLRGNDGGRVAAGEYLIYGGIRDDRTGDLSFDSTRITVTDADGAVVPAPAPESAIEVRIASPANGAIIAGQLAIAVDVGGIGASHVAVEVVGPAQLSADRSFPDPVVGPVRLAFDGASLPAGEYKVRATASNGDASAIAFSTFSVIPRAADDVATPVAELLYPRGPSPVPPRFPVVFTVEDDTGIIYAEAHLSTADGGSMLVARHSWPSPVMAGAFVVDTTALAAGQHDLTVRLYDAGEHDAVVRTQVVTDPAARLPCAPQDVLTVEPPDWCAEYGFGATVPVPPTPEPTPPSDAGAGGGAELEYDVSKSGQVRNVTVDGRLVIERIDAAGADRAPVASAETEATAGDGRAGPVTATDRRLAVSSRTGELVTIDLDSELIVVKRGRNLLLETPEGQRIIVAVTDGDVRVLGSRILAELAEGAAVVARPIDDSSPVERGMADALVAGHVGAEVEVAREGSSFQSYAPMAVNVSVEDTTIGPRAIARLDSDDPGGRTVVFRIDRSIQLGDEIEVLLDGEPVVPADDLADVLDPTNDDGLGEYYVVVEGDQPTVLVSVPHFSTRTVVVQSLGAYLPPFVTPGAVAVAVAVVAGAAVLMFRRPEEP